jgi:hypothetical protein
MSYSLKVEYVDPRKIRDRNKVYYRINHLPIWIFVFFVAPGPLTFELFAHGGNFRHWLWLLFVLVATAIAGYFGQLPGVEPKPYILRFNEDKRNPLYRRICYTFAWNALVNFALLNAVGLFVAVTTRRWMLKQIYANGYFAVLAALLIAGAAGILPRAKNSTKFEGFERRYFYSAMWAVTSAQVTLLILWKTMPRTHASDVAELCLYLFVMIGVGFLATLGMLPRTRPILPGEWMVAD